MKPKEFSADVGVIVGRFQVNELHKGQLELIEAVASRHQRVIVILGLSPCKVTLRNPLDFEARKQMILEKYPEITIAYIKDVRDDVLWSRKLDEIVRDLIGPNHSVILYGSRDSFIPKYNGTFHVCELESNIIVSGAEVRKLIGIKAKSSSDFRAGVVWAVGNQYHHPFTTVDVAICNDNYSNILLARKPDEKLYRFVGGFATNTSKTFEEDARREVLEETHLEVSDPVYLGSALIKDWRYEEEVNKIKTLFFLTKRIYGAPEASDDISELVWFQINTFSPNASLVEEHHVLWNMLMAHLGKGAK